MTLREALALYRQFKGVAVYKLKEQDWRRLQKAAQIIRSARKIRNPKSRNPLSPELIRLAIELNSLAVERPPSYQAKREAIFKKIKEILDSQARGVSLKSNPSGKRITIYGQIIRIEAKKGPGHRCDSGCVRSGHSYYHDFTPGGVIYGLPDGSVLIKRRDGKPLWKYF